MKLIGYVLFILGSLLILDAMLAIILGERYILWGLDYTPNWYRSIILKISRKSPIFLAGIKGGEAILGLLLCWVATKL